MGGYGRGRNNGKVQMTAGPSTALAVRAAATVEAGTETGTELRPRTLAALALLSSSGLGLELALTRVVSALHSATYVYLVLSVALLGLGVGAALLTLRPRWRARLPLAGALACLSTALLTFLLLHAAGLPPAVLFTAAALPFVFIGLAVAAVFARHAAQSPALYGVDLAGAGLGALLSVPLLTVLGPPSTMLAAAAAFGVSGLLFARPQPRRDAFVSCALIGGALILGTLALETLPGLTALNVSALLDKPIAAALAEGGVVTETRWDALARTDLVYNAARDRYALYMDGGAGSVVPDLGDPETWGRGVGSFPFLSDPPERTFLLGPGGGLDIALALAAGARTLVAAELNAASVELVRGLAPQVGDLYGGVTLMSEEGRSALARSGRFDLIFLSHVITQTAEPRGYALSENTVYTTEAFHLYLEHLTPEGQIAVKLYDEPTLTRALTTVLQTFRERGVPEREAMTHLVALLDTRESRPVPLLLIRKQPLTPAEAERLARLAERRGYALLLVPRLLEPPALSGLARGDASLAEVVNASSDLDLRPTTDAQPFFFHFQRGVPREIVRLLLALGGVLLATCTGVAWLTWRARRTSHTVWREQLRQLPLFATLGVGFITSEIFVLQRSQLLLGQPTLTLSLVLGTLLLAGGVGSACVIRVPVHRQRALIAGCGVLIVVTLLLWAAAEPLMRRALTPHAPALRGAAIVLSLVPLGVLLGIPFPTALRAVRNPRGVAAAWLVSGLFSVFGGVMALTLAFVYGYTAVGVAALVAYLAAVGLAFLEAAPEPTPRARSKACKAQRILP